LHVPTFLQGHQGITSCIFFEGKHEQLFPVRVHLVVQ